MLFALLATTSFAEDVFTCTSADPTVSVDLESYAHFGYPRSQVDMLEAVLGAGGGAVTFDNAPITQTRVNALMAAGPAGHSLNQFGYLKDAAGEPVDHYLWLWTEKASENGRKYLWVLTDRTVTGDADPKKYGQYQVIWAARYSRNPVAGDTWPTLLNISDTLMADISEYLQRFEAAFVSGGAGGLVATAKNNCAGSYSSSWCAAQTWSGVDRRFLIFHTAEEAASYLTANGGTALLHDVGDPDESDTTMRIGSWILVIVGGCQPGPDSPGADLPGSNATCAAIPQSQCPALCMAAGKGEFTGCEHQRAPNGGCTILDCWNGAGCTGPYGPSGHILTDISW